MKYDKLKNVIDLLEQFESENSSGKKYADDIEGFKGWISNNHSKMNEPEPNWEGKENGRGAESIINTLFVHLNRYAKSYSKSALFGSDFSTQEDFIYLINLKAFGAMTKMDLIKKNVHEKPTGMQIINRLIAQEWVDQTDSESDKRSKVLNISSKGIDVLEKQMEKIRQATTVVTGNLTQSEKMELIRLLSKLNNFHLNIYHKNIQSEYLLDEALKYKKTS